MFRRLEPDNGLCASDAISTVKVETLGNDEEWDFGFEEEGTGARDFRVGRVSGWVSAFNGEVEKDENRRNW